MEDEKQPMYESGTSGLLKLFGAAFMGKLMQGGDRKRRRGSHPKQPIHFKQHRPAGSKLSRKVSRPSRFGHMGGYGQ